MIAALLLFSLFYEPNNSLLQGRTWTRMGRKAAATSLAIARTTTVDDWILQHGGMIGSIATVAMKGNVPSCEREVTASASIQQGEVVLAIPRHCILTKEKAVETTFGKALSQRGDTLSDDGSYLTLILCEELAKGRRNEVSDIYEYIISNLPSLLEFSHLPEFWNEEELMELQGSTVLSFVSLRKSAIAADYIMLCDCSTSFQQGISELEFRWLHAAITSRSFSFHTNAHYEVALMVPMADMLNDNKYPELDWAWDDAKDMFTLTTLMAVEKGQPLHISYGRVPNFARIFNYGFTLDGDMMEEMEMPSDFSSHQARFTLSLFSLLSLSAVVSTVGEREGGGIEVEKNVDTDKGVGGGGIETGTKTVSVVVESEIGLEDNLEEVHSWYDTFVNSKYDSPIVSRTKFLKTVHDAASKALNEKILKFKLASWAAVLNISSDEEDSVATTTLLTSSVSCQLAIGSLDAAMSALSLIRVSVIPDVLSDSTHRQGQGEGELEYTELLRRIEETLDIDLAEQEHGGNDSNSSDDNDENNDSNNENVSNHENFFAANKVAQDPISWANEKRTMQAFRSLLLQALNAFPTSFDEDSILLNQTKDPSNTDKDYPLLTNNKRNAMVCRMGEKKVYLHYLDIADVSLKYMMLETKDFSTYRTLLIETLGSRD